MKNTERGRGREKGCGKDEEASERGERMGERDKYVYLSEPGEFVVTGRGGKKHTQVVSVIK